MSGYVYPFLLCDIDDIDTDLIGWSNPYSSYDTQNIIYDVPKIAAMKLMQRKIMSDDTYSSDAFVDNVDNEDNVDRVVDLPIFAVVESWGSANQPNSLLEEVDLDALMVETRETTDIVKIDDSAEDTDIAKIDDSAEDIQAKCGASEDSNLCGAFA